jgi:hypothetical protein
MARGNTHSLFGEAHANLLSTAFRAFFVQVERCGLAFPSDVEGSMVLERRGDLQHQGHLSHHTV